MWWQDIALLLLLVLDSSAFRLDCPCSYKEDKAEVTCDEAGQVSLPFQLPDCIAADVLPEKVRIIILSIKQNI